jgi:signal transduction histidine kinase
MFKKLRNRILAFNMIVTTLLVATAFALVYATFSLFIQSSYDARLTYAYSAGDGILFNTQALSNGDEDAPFLDDNSPVTNTTAANGTLSLAPDDTVANGTLSLASGDTYSAYVTLSPEVRPSFTALVRNDDGKMYVQALILFRSQGEVFCRTATELAWEDFIASGMPLDEYSRTSGSLTFNDTDLRYSVAPLESVPLFMLPGPDTELLLDYETMASLGQSVVDGEVALTAKTSEEGEAPEVSEGAETGETPETGAAGDGGETGEGAETPETSGIAETGGVNEAPNSADPEAILASKTTDVTAAAEATAREMVRAAGVVTGTWYQINFIDTTVEGLNPSSLMLVAIVAGILIEAAIFFISFFFAQRAVRPIEAMYEQQRRLVADASHELKTPLTTIMANYEVATLDEEATIGSQREWLQAMRTGMDRMRHTITGLMSLAQAEESPATRLVEKSATPVDLCCVVSDELRLREAEIAARGQTLTQTLNDKPLVCLSEEQLRQIVSILIDNALTYGAADGQIECTVERKGRSALLTVRNTGAGIPKEDLPHVFERFYRVDKARSGEGGNAGLGLAIARSLVEGMGGRISAESTPGSWTTFTISLPIP